MCLCSLKICLDEDSTIKFKELVHQIMRNTNYLFSKIDWFSAERCQRAALKQEVEALDKNQMLNTPVNDLCAYFVERYRIDIPVLNRDQIEVDQHEIQVDVRGSINYAIDDLTQPFYVPGTEIEVSVPFTSEAEGFTIQPTTHLLNPPRGTVRDNVLVLSITGVDLEADRVRQEIDSELDRIESYLTSLRGSADRLNGELDSIARQCIE